MVQDELREQKCRNNPQLINYAAGRLLAITVYCLRHKFESIGQLISTVYAEV